MTVVKFSSALLFCLVLITACSRSRPPGVSIGGVEAPTFTLYGDGRLRSLEVYEVKAQPGGGQVLTQVWGIQRFRDEPRFTDLGTISYGVVPQGYEQSCPPHQLDTKQGYECWVWINGKLEVIEHFFNDGSKWGSSMAH